MIGDNVTKGYDLFEVRNIPTPHGSGSRPMYADMGKSCRPDPNRKIEYPCVIALFTLDSHNTSYLYRREDRTYYWQHCRKETEDDIFVDADGLQLDMLGDPVLSKEWILKAIL